MPWFTLLKDRHAAIARHCLCSTSTPAPQWLYLAATVGGLGFAMRVTYWLAVVVVERGLDPGSLGIVIQCHVSLMNASYSDRLPRGVERLSAELRQQDVYRASMPERGPPASYVSLDIVLTIRLVPSTGTLVGLA